MTKWWKPRGKTLAECQRLLEDERAWLRYMCRKFGRIRTTDADGQPTSGAGDICFCRDNELGMTGIRFKVRPNNRDWTSRRYRSALPEGFYFPRRGSKLPGLRRILEEAATNKCNSPHLLERLLLPAGTNPFSWDADGLVRRRLRYIELDGELYIGSGFDCNLRGCRRVSDITIDRLIERSQRHAKKAVKRGRVAKRPVKQAQAAGTVDRMPVGRKKVAARRAATAKKSTRA